MLFETEDDSQSKIQPLTNTQTDANEIVIYRAKMKEDWRGSPNRVGLSVIGLVIARYVNG